VVIDVRARVVAKITDYQLAPRASKNAENLHGRIHAGAIVMLRTDGRPVADAQKYRNQDPKGSCPFSCFSPERRQDADCGAT